MKDLRERVAKIIGFSPKLTTSQKADQILALAIEGIEVEAVCKQCHNGISGMNVGIHGDTVYCGICQGTGKIRISATIEDIDGATIKSGGRLVIRK